MKRDINVIGIDIAKRVFHVIGMVTRGTIILRKRLYRGEVMSLMAQLPRATVGMEACGGAHYWARQLRQQGVWPKNSCGLALVVFQQPAKPLTTLQWACTYCVLAARRKEQHIVLTLMIALVMIMLHVLVERMPQRGFPKQNQP